MGEAVSGLELGGKGRSRFLSRLSPASGPGLKVSGILEGPLAGAGARGTIDHAIGRTADMLIRSRTSLLVSTPAFLAAFATWGWAQAPSSAPDTTTTGAAIFAAQIRPALVRQCLACHNSSVRKGGLDLSTRQALLRGGDSGPAIELGNAKDSLLYKAITHEQEPGMPYQAAKLSDALIARFADWINTGAPYTEAASSSSASAPVQPAAP